MLVANSVKDVQKFGFSLFCRIVAQAHLECFGPNISPFQVLAQTCPPRVVEQFVRVRPLVDWLSEAQVYEVLACFADLYTWVELVNFVCHSVSKAD